jgi:hypothetical protein
MFHFHLIRDNRFDRLRRLGGRDKHPGQEVVPEFAARGSMSRSQTFRTKPLQVTDPRSAKR